MDPRSWSRADGRDLRASAPDLDDVDELRGMLHASGAVLAHRRVGYDVRNVKNHSPELVNRTASED
jgi:hypothetical protein